MEEFKCKICGGRLAVSLRSERCVCENCGNTFDVEPQDIKKLKSIYRQAELKTHMNSLAGYQEAISLLQTIPNVEEAKEKIAFFQSRLSSLKEAQQEKAQTQEKTEKNNSKIGIIILVFALLFLALAVAGIVFIIFKLKTGTLSPTATAIIIAVAVISVVLMIISKLKS